MQIPILVSIMAVKQKSQDRSNDSLNCTNVSIPEIDLCETKFRFLGPTDVPEVKALCRQWFPVEYPDAWYEDITSSPRFYALAAIYDDQIMGLLIAETKNLSKLSKEDQEILPSLLGKSIEVGYILTLGVSKELRRLGVASLLLDHYLRYLTQHETSRIQAILLHVLTTNSSAITFYEKRQFVRHSFLPYYYSIKGKPRDGFSYVRYINGGHPPWTALDYFHHFLTSMCFGDLVWWPLRVVAKIFTLVGHQTTSTLSNKFF